MLTRTVYVDIPDAHAHDRGLLFDDGLREPRRTVLCGRPCRTAAVHAGDQLSQRRDVHAQRLAAGLVSAIQVVRRPSCTPLRLLT